MTTHRNYHISRPNIFVYFIVLCSPHIFHRTILSRTLLRMIGRNNQVKVEIVGINCGKVTDIGHQEGDPDGEESCTYN